MFVTKLKPEKITTEYYYFYKKKKLIYSAIILFSVELTENESIQANS